MCITYKELFPIAISCALWGAQWHQKRVQFQCDNASVVAILQTGTSKDPNNRAFGQAALFKYRPIQFHN